VTTAVTQIERTVPAVRRVLAEHAPADRARFDAEYHAALLRAGVEFDLAPVEAVLDRWWGVATIRVNPLTADERRLVESARAGTDAGWITRADVTHAPH